MPAPSPPGVDIRPARTRRDVARFVALPYNLYRDSPNWVGPLRRDQSALIDPRRNAFFAHGEMELFLAEQAGRVVGRVAAISNGRHLQVHRDGAGFFGFFEVGAPTMPAGAGVARALLHEAAAWLRERGLERMVGPVSPTLHDTSGVLVRGFDRPPAVMMPHNPEGYEALLLDSGFERLVTLLAFYGAWRHLDVERLRRGTAAVRRRYPDLRVRPADTRRYDAELGLVHRLYDQCFAEEWGFVPLTGAEFAQMGRSMRPIIDSRLVLFAEAGGVPVGFALSLPDVNRALRHVRSGRLSPANAFGLAARLRFGGLPEFRTILLGVAPEWRRRGVDALLVLETVEAGRAAGYVAAELGWVMAHNRPLINALQSLGAVVDKEYAIFERRL
jgi:GNAT superfamily N-acetyltransferase